MEVDLYSNECKIHFTRRVKFVVINYISDEEFYISIVYKNNSSGYTFFKTRSLLF